ncbi:unnamed protein product [Diamesa serratosioi]
MHLKIPSSGSSGDENCEKINQEKNCTASIYISQPISSTDEVKLNKNHHSDGSVGSSGQCEIEQKPPVLTIQVNQSPDQNNSNNQNLVNIDLHNSHQDDQIDLIGIDNIVITTNSGTAVPNKSQQQLSTSTTTINQISIIDECIGATTADTAASGVDIIADDDEVNQTANETVPKTSVESQTFREQRRKERRERRQARQRAQHLHHVTTPVHHQQQQQQQHQRISGSRFVNGLQLTRNSYDILPDLINNHLPPPYTTLPLHSPPIPSSAPPSSVPPMVPTINVTTSVPVIVDDCRFTFPIPVIRRSPSEHSGRKGCCGQFFQSPKSLGLIAMVALGGVACALGGAALGASGLAGPPTTHLTVSLLMIGIGVVLVTISGVAWRITTADSTVCLGIEHGPDFEHCGRQQCMRNSGMSHGLLYPEFQHRSPPPSYQASMQEYRLRLLLLDRDRQSHARRMAAAQSASQSPPPTYRSNVGTLLR